MTRLIERFRGVAAVSPSMRETPVDDPREAIDFANRLISGQVDVVVLQTGVGTKQLVAQIERHVDRARFLTALSDATTIARGPKPVAALREFEIRPSFVAPEPNTWREVLQTVDLYVPVANLTVAVQEYGNPNISLMAGLEARGARVMTVKVYGYDLPEDIGPLEANIRAIAAGEIDVALFTSAHQVTNLLRMARQMELADELRDGFRKTVVASIGPTTSEMLQEHELPVDLEPEHPKMGHLVSEAAAASGLLVAKKRGSAPASFRASTAAPAGGGKQPAWYDSPFMKACRREPCDRVPIWLMRQAGRYMAEYREVRAKTTFLELCKNPVAVRRGDDHGRQAAGRRCGDHLFRSAADPRTDGRGSGVRRRRRPGDSQPGARSGRRRSRAGAGGARLARIRDGDRAANAGRAR